MILRNEDFDSINLINNTLNKKMEYNDIFK